MEVQEPRRDAGFLSFRDVRSRWRAMGGRLKSTASSEKGQTDHVHVKADRLALGVMHAIPGMALGVPEPALLPVERVKRTFSDRDAGLVDMRGVPPACGQEQGFAVGNGQPDRVGVGEFREGRRVHIVRIGNE